MSISAAPLVMDINIIKFIVLCTSDIKDSVYGRAEGEFTNKSFDVTSAKNDLGQGRSVVKQKTCEKFSGAELSHALSRLGRQ